MSRKNPTPVSIPITFSGLDFRELQSGPDAYAMNA